ncbi:MAG: TonB-dependent receptor plug domain-containing protein [Desulfobacteraceae bacterium]|jgi:outer membrane cobalamin receptor
MRKKTDRAILTLLIMCVLILTAGLPVFADEKKNKTALDDMVVTATRSEEEIKEIPAKVEVIDTQAIELTVGETLTEQLKKNVSIGVIEYPGALAGIGIRGFRPEFFGITKHSLLLINGRPAGATNLSTIISDSIERIEVLKGPASSLYGGEAMGGVVNVILKKNTDELTAMAEAGYGSFATNYQKGAVGGAIGKGFDLDFSVRRYEQADDITMGNGQERPNTSFLTQNGLLRPVKTVSEERSKAWNPCSLLI